MPPNRLFLALCMLFLAQAAIADIYKCRLPNGQTEISNTPCAGSGNTLSVRPDEPVSDRARREAERDLERIRGYIDQREAAQRAEAAEERLERRERARREQAVAPRREYGDPDACLRDLAGRLLDINERERLEAACRALVKQPDAPLRQGIVVTPPVYLPPPGNHFNACVESIQRQNLPPAERDRRLSQCHSTYAAPVPTLPGAPAFPPQHSHRQSAPAAPTIELPVPPASRVICAPGKPCPR